MKWILPLYLGGVLLLHTAHAQEGSQRDTLARRLDSLSYEFPSLQQTTDAHFDGVSLAEVVRSLGQAYGLNVYIADTPKLLVHAYFEGSRLSYVFLFLCRQFHYDFQITGDIWSFFPQKPPTPLPTLKPNITWDGQHLGYDLQDDSLRAVIRMISQLTGKRIISPAGMHAPLSGYLPPSPLDTALEALFLSNGFKLRPQKGYELLVSLATVRELGKGVGGEGLRAGVGVQQGGAGFMNGQDFEVALFEEGGDLRLRISAREASVQALLEEVFAQTGLAHVFYEPLKGQISLEADMLAVDQALARILSGTDYAAALREDCWYLGPKDAPALQEQVIFALQHRPAKNMLELIPGMQNIRILDAGEPRLTASTATGPQIQNTTTPLPTPKRNQHMATFSDAQIRSGKVGPVLILEYQATNELILHGPPEEVQHWKAYLQALDRPVPLVRIEMIVVEVNKDRLLQTGIEAGWKPGRDSLPRLLDLLPGLQLEWDGTELQPYLSELPVLSNLGVLNSDFYVQLRAQEQAGNLEVEMQPVLSTLNGQTASLVIGQTQYFLLETQTAATGTVNNFSQFSQRFEKIEANIRLQIRPMISAGDMLTLEVAPDFTTPIGQFDAQVPPTIATRRFQSSIRLRNGETVLLGGLSEVRQQNSSSGLPLLSRIPVLKWIFAQQDRSHIDRSLLIYITPVIFYE